MPEQPFVSIVIPTRNRRPSLERCLKSLVAQSYKRYEVIVVDDGSTDDTPQFLERFSAGDQAVDFRWLRNQPQIGANPSRNRGVMESRGDFIAFGDDDIIASPDWLERLMAGFVSDSVAAVTGRVDNIRPRNIYELTLKGTQRVYGRVHATRLVGCNMCIRRDLLLKYGFDEDRAAASPDVTVSGRGDEEGLYLMLRAAGYEQRVVHDAVVVHDHPHTHRTFFRQAYRGGQAAARLARKYHLTPRIELLALLLAYLTLPAVLITPVAWLVPMIMAGFFLAAVLYNDLFRKRKTVWEVLITFPLLMAYYHARLAGYAIQWLSLWTGRT